LQEFCKSVLHELRSLRQAAGQRTEEGADMVSFPQGYTQISVCRMVFHTVASVGLQAVPDPRQTEEWRSLHVAITLALHQRVLAGRGYLSAVGKKVTMLRNHFFSTEGSN
jgi:hypothetical protein